MIVTRMLPSARSPPAVSFLAATLAVTLALAAGFAAGAHRGGRKRRARRGPPPQDHPTSSLRSRLEKAPLPPGDPSASVAEPLVQRVVETHLTTGGDFEGCVVVGIAGGTGSGKTSLARAVHAGLGGEGKVAYLCHDSYYRDLSHLPLEERARNNFDHPDSLETELLVEHLRALKRGEPVCVPVYDFSTHTRRQDESVVVEPRRVIILEGILIFSDPDLVAEMDMKIFVDTDADVRFVRRLQRDVTERGRTVQSVVDQYLTTVRPMHEQFVEPTRSRSDLIVPVGLNQNALDMIVGRLRFVVG